MNKPILTEEDAYIRGFSEGVKLVLIVEVIIMSFAIAVYAISLIE